MTRSSARPSESPRSSVLPAKTASVTPPAPDPATHQERSRAVLAWALEEHAEALEALAK